LHTYSQARALIGVPERLLNNMSSSLATFCAELREHFCQRPTPRQALVMGFTAMAFLAIGLAIGLGYLQDMADAIRDDLGVEGHVIFAAFLVYSGLPFAYGWSFFVISLGYTYGWIAMITANMGTWAGHVLGFMLSRHCLKQTVVEKVASLPPHWQEWVELVQLGVARSRSGIFIGVLVRWGTPLSFGMCNAFDAALTFMPYSRSMMGSFIAAQKDITTMIYIGTLLRQMDEAEEQGSGDEESRRREAAVRMGLFVVQVAFILFLILLVSYWAKRTLDQKMRARRASMEQSIAAKRAPGLPPVAEAAGTTVV